MFKDTSIGKNCKRLICLLECGAPISDLIVRIWIANVFWKSGLTKISNMDSTIFLFQYEYAVPVIPYELAAYLATATELIFPILLVFGIGGRFAAIVLFVFNFVAVISYPTLNAAGVLQHQVWGILLLITCFRGPGVISIDHFIRKRLLG